ncbi:uncharacterized protein EDB91DRAFT_1252135 [Suillus paluster]|uniref:uncharacterized protein n=1 Tax=Suillus paluster TaxID=48578 RepID=UPI001B881C95|nr:uncharacterized protein EDB91DRAFT_1252135 [Suillus paluster]KAG1731496.1 hypothetical protein EDB91DRAFT_1252135 [Suillus paluster]
MKRGAERQISKDDNDDDIEEVDDPGKGFQKADESVLTKRHIRALPKRAMASNKSLSFAGLSNAPLAPADSEPPASPKFGGFSGFGSGATSSPFSFTPSPTAFAASNVAPSASAATKGFASVVQSATTANASPSAPDEDCDAALKYYKSIRGLNVSFLSAVQTAVDQDPFVDIAGLLESYKNLRTTVQTDLDSSSKAASQKAFASAPPAPEKAAPSATGFPVPKGFSGFNSFASPSLPTPSMNGNTDKSSAPKSVFPFSTSSSSTNPSAAAFNFGAKPSEDTPAPPSPFGTSEAPKSAFAFGTKPDEPSSSSPSPFSFAPPPASATSKDKEDSKFSSSAFGSSSSIPNFFASSKAASSTFSDLSSKPTSAFGTSTSLFGNSADSSKPSLFTPGSSDLFNKVSAKTDTGNEEPKTGNTTGLFGNPSFTPTPSTFASDKPTSAFGTFGGGSPPKGNGFTFGKVGGSIGNPVGFGFGVAKPADGASMASSSAPVDFSFGAPPTKSTSPPMEVTSRSGSQPSAGEEAVQDDAKLLPTSNHDEEGEGEEDEDTTYTVKAKVFKLSKTSDKSEWKELGVGMLRLKKHKETGARRVLMRNSATGRIIINFRLFASLTPTLLKTMVSFVGHDDGAPASFRIRVKNPEQAQELKDALERETTAVKESN